MSETTRPLAPPTELIAHLNRGDCVLFVGDALDGEGSQSARLAAALVDACGAHALCPVPSCQSGRACIQPHACAVPLARAAQLYEGRTNRQALVDFVIRHVDNASPPSPVHHALARLPVRVIITTAYDDRLEAALRLANRPYLSVVRDTDVPFDDPGRVQLIRLHGTVSQPDSLVLTEDDAADLFARLPAVTRVLQAHFASKTLLFVGYGLAEPHFQVLYRQVTGPLAGYQRLAYAVQPAPEPLLVDRWRGKVSLVDAEPASFLARWAQAPEPHPSLALKLSVKPETVDAGDEVTWTVTLRNDGDDDLRHVTVRHGRTLLDDPVDLAAGKGRRFTFTTMHQTTGQKTEKVMATGIASNGTSVRRDALATVQVRSSHPATPELEPPRRRQTPTPPAPEVVTITAPIHLELVRVPAGEFLMGSDAKDGDAHADEQPQHPVYVPEFYMGRYPVTNEQYAAFVEATGRRVPSHWQEGQIPAGKENHPVVYVSWLDVRAFCKWLSQETGQDFRLPTEAEWEKAASWDERADQKWRYPWGDRFDQTRCNAKASSMGGTTLVGEYSPAGDSPYGCADMAGNVWDWTSSLYKEYPYRTDDGREDPTGSDSRVLRGGSFNSPVGRARVAFRLAKFTDFSDERRGCRVCATAPLNTEALNVAASPVPPSRPDALVAVPAKPPGLTWDIAVLRQLLNDAFDDPELDAFCLEQFPKVYDKFSRGMRKDEKITLLLDYGRRRPTHRQKLLNALEEWMR